MGPDEDLWRAAHDGQTDVITRLIADGADPDGYKDSVRVKDRDRRILRAVMSRLCWSVECQSRVVNLAVVICLRRRVFHAASSSSAPAVAVGFGRRHRK